MSAGRDVEQLIATWLVEEAPARAPDRVLDEAGRHIDHTRQRRFAVDWREPMIISMGRLVAAAAIFLVAVVGAGFVGRASAPGAGTTVPSAVASPSPSASAATLESFRAARNAICQRAGPSAQALNDAFSNPYDPGLTAAERSANADKLQAIIDFGDGLRAELAAVPVPPELAADQTAYLTRGEDLRVILAQEVLLLRAGKVSEAQQVDLLTDPINRQGEAFEQKYNLSPCP